MNRKIQIMTEKEYATLLTIQGELEEASSMLRQGRTSFSYSRVSAALEKLEQLTNNPEPQEANMPIEIVKLDEVVADVYEAIFPEGCDREVEEPIDSWIDSELDDKFIDTVADLCYALTVNQGLEVHRRVRDLARATFTAKDIDWIEQVGKTIAIWIPEDSGEIITDIVEQEIEAQIISASVTRTLHSKSVKIGLQEGVELKRKSEDSPSLKTKELTLHFPVRQRWALLKAAITLKDTSKSISLSFRVSILGTC